MIDGISDHAVDRVFRECYGQAVSTLVRIFGDITLAEDAVQDAFTVASERWRDSGIPPNPSGWIVTTARNRAIDKLRRSTRGRSLERLASHDTPDPGDREEEHPVPDDRLRLIFTCCHPALSTDHRIALTLRLLGGLSVDEIARMFLVSEAAMTKRLVRAKYKIKAAQIPYRVPEGGDLIGRLGSVLAVLYLIYTTGTDSRSDLTGEAIRLCRVLAELMPDEAEVTGLLALMLLNEARAPAHRCDGDLVLLVDQDRGLWDQRLIAEGHELVRRCVRRDRPGRFQLEAAIQAVHCDATTFADTDWSQIVALYDHLLTLMPTDVVRLNRAIAISELDGPDAGLTALDGLDLDGYHLLHAARAKMLRRLGRQEEAIAALHIAVAAARTKSDEQILLRQLDQAR